MKYTIKIFLFYIFLFSISFTFFPVRLRLLFSLYGIWRILQERSFISISVNQAKIWKKLLLSCVFFIIILLTSTVINDNFDATLFKYPVSILLSLTAAYGFIEVFFKLFKEKLTVEKTLNYIIITAVVECLLTVVIYLNPSIRDVLFNVIALSDMSEQAMGYVNEGGYRFAGIGAAFFGGGIFYALCLLYIAMKMANTSNFKAQIIYVFVVAIITIVGSAVARTTLVGLFGFLAYLVLVNNKIGRKFTIVIVAALGLMTTLSFYSNYLENNDAFGTVFERAFSLFYTYMDTGEVESTAGMMGEMVTPQTMKTWIIGDAQMVDPYHPTLSYYMHIDRGMWRLIWGYGVCGMLIYFYIQWVLCKLTNFPKTGYFVLFGMILLFLQKGLIGFDHLLSLFIMLPIYKQIQSNRKLYFKGRKR